MSEIKPIYWESDRLMVLDQTVLPHSEIVLELSDYKEVIEAIKEMRIRGAPALGITAAYALAMAARKILKEQETQFLELLRKAAAEIKMARVTAVNAAWAVDHLCLLAEGIGDPINATNALLCEAKAMQKADVQANKLMGLHGSTLLGNCDGVLTHCNTGALATAGYGTALGVIRAAWEQGLRFKVFHTETRPFLQGSRLTAWELVKLGIPSTLLVDSAAGTFIREKIVQCVIVGADRIASNGDTANKIGTYSLAVLAKENNIPFYVAAPTSTVDLGVMKGSQIPIEERHPDEVACMGDRRIAANGIEIRNPSFDITPHRYISAIITEKGIVNKPYRLNLSKILKN